MTDTATPDEVEADAPDVANAQELFQSAQQAIEDFIATLGTLAEKLDALQPVADEVKADAMEDAVESMQALAERTSDVGEELQQADETGATALRDTLSAIADQVHEAAANTASTVARLGDEGRELDEAFAKLDAGLSEAMSTLSGAYADHGQALAAAQRELVEQLRQGYDDRLTAGADQMGSAVEQFSASAEESVKRLIDLLAQAVLGLADAVEQSVRHAESEREPAQAALDAVKLVFDPLMDEVERVKDLAESVGISI